MSLLAMLYHLLNQLHSEIPLIFLQHMDQRTSTTVQLHKTTFVREKPLNCQCYKTFTVWQKWTPKSCKMLLQIILANKPTEIQFESCYHMYHIWQQKPLLVSRLGVKSGFTACIEVTLYMRRSWIADVIKRKVTGWESLAPSS